MKKIYALLAVILFLQQNMNAQLTLTKAANEPVIGDINVTKGYDSTVAVPKNTGINQTWSFTAFSANTNSASETYTNVASVPAGSLFPGASLAYKKTATATETEFHSTTGSSYEYMGSYDTNGPITTTLSNTAIMAIWPISIGSGTTDVITGSQTTGTVVTPWNGTISYTASGSGTVTLPGGNVLTNCLQVVRTLSLTMGTGTNAAIYFEKTYMYYSSLYKFPVMEILYSSVTQGTTVTKDYSLNGNLTAVSLGLKENQIAKNEFVIYPNPAIDQLTVVHNKLDVIKNILILDLAGKLVKEISNAEHINVSDLNRSVYILKLITDNASITKG